MRALEGTEDKVLRLASDLHRLKGLPPVVVHVLWHPHQAFSRRRTQKLAADLADLCRSVSPSRATKPQFVTAATLRGDHRRKKWRR